MPTACINALRPPPGSTHAQVADGAGMASLTVSATNEYGKYGDAALALYGLEMVVEPHRATTLTATSSLVGDGDDGAGNAPAAASTFYVWRLLEMHMDDEGTLVETSGEDAVFEGEAGPQISVELTKPGGVFRLTVEERLDSDGGDGGPGGPGAAAAAVIVARATVTISCKYVRRELRELTDADRRDVLDAMEVYYTVPTEEGKSKYGSNFFNYELLTAYHNADVSYALRNSLEGPECPCVLCCRQHRENSSSYMCVYLMALGDVMYSLPCTYSVPTPRSHLWPTSSWLLATSLAVG